MLYPMFLQHQPFGGFVGELPDFPGCRPEGDTMDELLENVPSAVRAWMAENGRQDMPAPSELDVADDACPPLLVDIAPMRNPEESV